jgi:hypothetical protein
MTDYRDAGVFRERFRKLLTVVYHNNFRLATDVLEKVGYGFGEPLLIASWYKHRKVTRGSS